MGDYLCNIILTTTYRKRSCNTNLKLVAGFWELGKHTVIGGEKTMMKVLRRKVEKISTSAIKWPDIWQTVTHDNVGEERINLKYLSC